MSTHGFFPHLNDVSRRANSLLCIGLDPPLDLPATELLPAARRVIDATASSACAFKPNAAFYEARGLAGWEALAAVIRHVHERGLPVILDAKRGDISSTADAYARACFDELGADAVTASPFLGHDSVASLSSRIDKGVFLLCHTSNPGARDIQELSVDGEPLYRRIAAMARTWSDHGTIGLVVGATFPHLLADVRETAPDLWILLPGVGAQGGDLEESLSGGLDDEGSKVLVNVSRAIWQAADPGEAAREMCLRIQKARAERRPGTRRNATAAASRGATRDAAAASLTLVEQIALGLHDLGAVRFGEFTLKSGKRSPVYIDLRLLVSDPRLMKLVAKGMAALLEGLSFQRLAAIPYGGLPIGQAVSLESGKPLVYPRREAKDYGTKKLIEGAFSAGETVVVIDDLVTTGGSKLEAIAPLSDAGLAAKDVVVLIDREQGGGDELASHGLALHSVLTLSQLLEVLVRHGRINEAVRSDVRASLGIA